jgi:hypothetical protein
MYYTPDELLAYIIAKSNGGGDHEPAAGSASFLLDAALKLAKPAYRAKSRRLCFKRKPRHLR